MTTKRPWLIGWLIGLVLLAPILLWLALQTFLLTVDRTEFAYVTRFGRHIGTFDGAVPEQAGLHWRMPWPIESVRKLDRRLQYFDLPSAELLTHDPKRQTIDRTLNLVAYACWRIDSGNDGVDRFVRTIGSPEQAKTILGTRISSQLGAQVGKMEMDDLISTEAGKIDAKAQELRSQLLTELAPAARKEYGIELVDVRLRRLSYPQAVRQEIYSRIISERNKKVADYQSEGAQLAENIRSEAARDAKNIRTEALARQQELKGHADAEADRIRNAAQAKDPEFYAFLKKLEAYTAFLGDNKTVLLLSSHRDLFDLLFKPPKPAPSNGKLEPGPMTRSVPPAGGAR
jgi:membrane protease subunit HflC